MRSQNRFLLITVILLLGPGCKGQKSTPIPPTETPAQITIPVTKETLAKQQITILTQDAVSTLDPYLIPHINPQNSVAAHLWNTLVRLDDDFELQPCLAKVWRLVSDLTWELELQRGVTFHNGEPFNARAVKFSLERTAQLENPLETFASDVALQSVEIVDDDTVRIHTAEPAVSMIYKLSSVEMLPPTYYAQTSLENLARNPVGSGPYQLASWDPNGRLVLEAYAGYWEGAPAIHTLVFQAESNADERLTSLAAGDADLITDLPPDRAEAANTEHTRLVAVESTRRLFVGLCPRDNTPLADKRVRQALNYATDVEALIAEFHAGYGQRYGSWVNPPNADPGLTPWHYDPDKARNLLAQTGYPQGFEIAMDTPVGRYHRDQEIAETIATQLAQIGITVTVQPQEWSTYTRERLIPKETAPLFLLSLMSWGNGIEDTRNLAYSFPFNPTLWYNQEFERLLNQAAKTFNLTLRLNLLHQAQTIAYQESPWIWLWRPYLFYGVSQELEGWQARADGLVYLYAPTPVTNNEQQ